MISHRTAQTTIKKVIRKLGIWLGLAIIFIFTFLAISYLSFLLLDRSFKDEVGPNNPGMFPILVITPGEGNGEYIPHMVYSKYLSDFIGRNPEYTYLVPENQGAILNEKILRKCRAWREPVDFDWESPDPWTASFKVKRIADGRQYLEIDCTWDDDRLNVGWYEATDKEIFPKYHKYYFGPGVVLRVLFQIVPAVYAVIGLSGFLIYKFWWQKRRAA